MKDPRIKRMRLHQLEDIVFITIAAVIRNKRENSCRYIPAAKAAKEFAYEVKTKVKVK